MLIAEDATFYTQRNNNIRPWGACGATSIVNALSLLSSNNQIAKIILEELSKNNTKQPEDSIMEILNSKNAWNNLNEIAPGAGYNPWNDSRVIAKTINDFAQDKKQNLIERKYVTMEELYTLVSKKNPVIMGGKFTSSGHFVCFSGVYETGFYIRDSWGDYRTNYQNHNGKDLPYSNEILNKVIFNNTSSPAMILNI